MVLIFCRCRIAVLVVLTDEDHGEVHHPGEIHRLVDLPLGHDSLPEE
jgi:hypothetical protein